VQNVLIAAYLIIVLALIGVILLQRSEGGGLGMGGSSTGLITVRGQANLLTRTTAILATLFFALAIGLSIYAELDRGTQGILQRAADAVGQGVDSGGVTVLDALNSMGGATSDLPVPATGTTPTTTTTTDPGLALPPATTETTTPTTSSDPGLAVPADPAAAPTTTAPAN
jgi:preprotein translocase subunit SecG